ncbi:NAD(P)H-dependent glycerol-3-phosphate dehydrogenase [Rothia sp. P13129]|uniref:NAD(P)H-dependent glycerol-3-phosphate dehydrogenase n=1 Tax=Rothia sp. P13129 TaxID=3402664 RepID=UPI003ACCE942
MSVAPATTAQNTNSIHKIAVLGAGSWGTAFAKITADTAREKNNGIRTILWGRNPERMEQCRTTRMNTAYFPQLVLPENLEYTSNILEALAGADIIVLAIPAQSLREQLKNFITHIPPHAILISLAKGLEQNTGLRMSEVIVQVLEEAGDPHAIERVAVLSGPNLAREIVAEQPTASVIAAHHETTAALLAELCNCSYFRPYTGTDIIGVEIGGIVKNIIALCVGICEGKDYGDNSKASVMTRGLAETTRLAVALGADPQTLSGLAGMGDLIATCSSSLSRNHTAGRLLAEGVRPEQLNEVMTQTAESIKSAAAVVELAHQHHVEMPICEAVVAVLNGTLTVETLAPRLLGRTLKHENHTQR